MARSFKMKFKLNLTWKIWILIIFLFISILSLFAGSNLLQEGVLIDSVEQDSKELEAGFIQGMVIKEINGESIESVGEYSNKIREIYSSNESERVTFNTDSGEVIFYSQTPPEILVSELASTNLQTGLDLSGGSRALIQAKNESLSQEESEELASMIKNRLDVYGIEDIQVNPISNLEGDNFVSVEIAGATPEDLERLISEQGRFEAKIKNETVFTGEDKDIASVARSGPNVGIRSCSQQEGGYFCEFVFSIFLSQEAAERHAEITEEIPINRTNPKYLEENLDLYLDGTLVNSLRIGKGLKGQVTTQVSISGSGFGESSELAYEDAEESMKQLQTVLITGSFPYELEVVKLDTISPTLGKEFVKSILLAAIVSILAVAVIVSLRYRNVKASLALILTSASELTIILGIAALVNWNLDLPSIAGILATIGVGIDSQIIILDESQEKFLSIKQRLKRAFAIIMGAYFTAVVALIPLYWAVAGLFKGFAITTILGITVGVLITRPAFSDIIKKIDKD